MFSLQYYKGFSIVRSFNIDETAAIICNMSNKIQKDLTRHAFYISTNMLTTNDNAVDEPNYCSVVKKVKKDNITPENISEIMLCQIPGISSVTSLAIINKFKTITNLIICIQNDSNCLNDITTTNIKGQQRKISKTCISNIYKFLLKK